LRRAFAATEKKFLQESEANAMRQLNYQSNELEEGLYHLIDKSGTCANVTLIVDDYVYVANVGDSRAIMSANAGQKIFALSKDHKPEEATEKQRIVSNGGQIYQTQN
jgi:protein phosphatase 2C family protein 2/3